MPRLSIFYFRLSVFIIILIMSLFQTQTKFIGIYKNQYLQDVCTFIYK